MHKIILKYGGKILREEQFQWRSWEDREGVGVGRSNQNELGINVSYINLLPYNQIKTYNLLSKISSCIYLQILFFLQLSFIS